MKIPSQPSPRIAPHHLAAALTLLATLTLGLWQLFLAARDIAYKEIPSSQHDVLTGKTAKHLESQLGKYLPAREGLISTANILRYIVLHGAGEQVQLGKENWLFLSDELRVYEQAQENMDARIKLIENAASALQQANVHLIVALVPDKSRIYENQLDSATRPAELLPRYKDTLAALQQAGVDAVDLATPLVAAAQKQEVYYRTDTHWNQVGARVAADAVATIVRRSTNDLATINYVTQSVGAVEERPGDLIRLMGLEHAPDMLRPTPDREMIATTTRTEADSGESLFGDSQVAVVLCGTSYALRGNFHGYLQQALSSEVLNTAKDGGGFLNSITAYLQDEAYRTTPPRVLIWEVPERCLQTPLDTEVHWLESLGLNRPH
ncbi:MAG: hypothetical protein ABL856_11300 [Gallionella sp.]